MRQAHDFFAYKTAYPVYEKTEVSKHLHRLFQDRCSLDSNACSFVLRAPGRVNIIGEHIDYNGYAVLPMAIDKAIYVAAGITKQPNRIKITSESNSLESFSGSIDEALMFAVNGPPCPLKWFHYVLCGYRAVYDYASVKYSDWMAPSLCLLVGHDQSPAYLPQCAGLASSSALVVAAALATMRISGVEIDPKMMAFLCATSEKLIGTQGGGMDQAACLLANETPMLIEFTKPMLTVKPVTLPPGGVFVIADSGARMHKATTPEFNQRVAECQQAVQALLANFSTNEKGCYVTNLLDAQQLWQKITPFEMLEGDNSPYAQTFKGIEDSLPAMRAKHVFSEADRVIRFQELCSSYSHDNLGGGDSEKTADAILVQLGELMNTSQVSCRDLYQCSSPEVDKLVSVCRSSGSLGSRLTGAGWGGCVVSLVKQTQLPQFLDSVAKGYFEKTLEELNSCLFSTMPSGAAGFFA